MGYSMSGQGNSLPNITPSPPYLNLKFIIEISPDGDFEKRKKSAEWLIEKLKKEKCDVEATFKTLHHTQGDFLIVLSNENEQKIIFSSSNAFVDTVTGNHVNKKNYNKIIKCIANYLKNKK